MAYGEGKFNGFIVGPIELPPKDVKIARSNWVTPDSPIRHRGFAYPSKALHSMLGTGTFRERKVGVPADIMLEEALPELIAVIAEESNHEGCKIRSTWDQACDMYSVAVHCPKCDRHWRHNTSGQVLSLLRNQSEDTADMASTWFHAEIVPFFTQICEEECFGIRDYQRLAEYVTKRVAYFGRQGVPYIQLVHEVMSAGLAPAEDIERLLMRLGFDLEWMNVVGTEWRLPILFLPEGHPARKW